MGLMDIIKQDVATITGDATDGFAVPLTFSYPDGTKTVTVNGLATKHSLTIDEMGAVSIGRNTHCSVAEALLIAQGYVTRNGDNQLNMQKHTVEWADSTGVSKKYFIKEQMPDDTLGLLLFRGLTNFD